MCILLKTPQKEIVIDGEKYFYQVDTTKEHYGHEHHATYFYLQTKQVPLRRLFARTAMVAALDVLFSVNIDIEDVDLTKEEARATVVSAHGTFKKRQKRAQEIKNNNII